MSHWDDSFEYQQHMFWLRNKKTNFKIRTYLEACYFFANWVIFHAFLSSADFDFSVKQFGSSSGGTKMSGLIWVQTVCKGYLQTTIVAS